MHAYLREQCTVVAVGSDEVRHSRKQTRSRREPHVPSSSSGDAEIDDDGGGCWVIRVLIMRTSRVGAVASMPRGA
jgi:hypothetical protein